MHCSEMYKFVFFWSGTDGTVHNVYRQYEERVEERQKQVGARKKGMLNKQSPLERGWTGGSPEGRKFGPPIPRNSSGNTINMTIHCDIITTRRGIQWFLQSRVSCFEAHSWWKLILGITKTIGFPVKGGNNIIVTNSKGLIHTTSRRWKILY